MRMPLLLADFTHARDCKLNLRKNVDTTWQSAYCFQNSFKLGARMMLEGHGRINNDQPSSRAPLG